MNRAVFFAVCCLAAPSKCQPPNSHASTENQRFWTVRTLRCVGSRSEEHTSELQSQSNLVCRLLLENNKYNRSPGQIRTRVMIDNTLGLLINAVLICGLPLMKPIRKTLLELEEPVTDQRAIPGQILV